jgi:glycosyltransferase involved in cell wall biosynthesis
LSADDPWGEGMAQAKLTASVIIPNFNHSQFVAKAIGSVLAQGDDVSELIVIDDGSTDNSVVVIEAALQGRPNARLLRNETNRGAVATLNRGINEASGDFVLLAAADDVYLPGMLGSCLRAVELHPDTAFVCGTTLIEWTDGSLLRVALPFGDTARHVAPEELACCMQRQTIQFFTGGALLRRQAIVAAGGLLPELRWHADWLLDLVLALRHGFVHLPQDCSIMKYSPRSYSQGRHDWSLQQEILRNVITLLPKRYPDIALSFRRAALLPSYNIAFTPTLLRDPELRPYATPLLLWRLCTYLPLQRASQIVPWTVRQKLRGYMRV